MNKILGLDLGTNSIGAALINVPESIEDFGKEGNIEWVGSRIVPIDAQYLNKWESGSKAETKAASRRIKRGSRRLKHRYKLRRTRLIQTFKILGWLNENFPENFKKEMNDDENFKFHISVFLPFAKETIEEATKLLGVENKKGELVLPEDWIIYYLRKKALTEKISIAELCRITYMMNQRRGFKSSRKDLKDENVEEKKWVEKLTILSVVQETFALNKNKNYKFKITTNNPKIEPWLVEKKKKPEWEGKEFTFLITEKIEIKKDGTKKVTQNNPQIPKEDDWALCVTAQDNQIGDEYPGVYFFNGLVNSIKNKTDFKIRQYAVYRKKYKKELEDIWAKQIELNEDLKRLNTDKDTLQKLAGKLYPTQTIANKPKLNEILSNTLLHLISDDIIYFQRDLKSQKSSRGECQYESHKGKEVDGIRETYGVKCAPKSSPEFQELRMWQDIHNIKILQRNVEENIDEKIYKKVDVDVTPNFIDDSIKENLFILFDTSKVVTQQNIFDKINTLKPEANLNNETHRINMFYEGKTELEGNQTKEYFRKIFRKKECNYELEGEKILSEKEKLYKLWNISYSISLNDEEKSKQAIFKALTEKENKRIKNKKITFNFPPNIARAIASAPDIETAKKYASYSSKAIHKLLPLMRCGKYYNPLDNEISILSQSLQNEKNEKTQKNITDEIKRINRIKERAKEITERLKSVNYNTKRIQEIADDDVQKQLLKSFINKTDLLRGLNTYQSCYLVYGRHSERTDDRKYILPSEFNIMEKLPNNSLRNPIVEQIIRETLFVVKDVWEKYGQPDEIHIEMGRDLKKNAKERENASKNSKKNYEEKQKIKKILYELLNDGFEQYENVDDDKDKTQKVTTKFEVKPNPNNPTDIDRFKIWKSTSGLRDDDFEKIIKEEKIPKNQELKKYALWLSQKCVSPYTGKIIPLNKLFDSSQYEIEHILPKAKIKNDSFDNLIISEWGVNKAKGNELAAIFINGKNGKCAYGAIEYQLFDYAAYVEHCKKTFRGKKLQNLLATEIPDDFISRQINDTRYITKKISELLYPVAKNKETGIVFTIGAITSELKKEWGLQKVWKQLIKPRFERLEKLNNSEYILQNQKDRNDIDFHIAENPDLDTKRIDHRHHALDAIVIAATTREHIRYLNSLNAADTDEEFKKARLTLVKGKIREWALPWELFTKESKEKLEQTVVTFKSYNKVIDKPQNRYTKWILKEGKWVKDEKVKQAPNKNWMAVRQSLFAEQPHGKVYIKEIIEKKFETPNQMLEIVKLQMKRIEAQNTPAKKNTDYIYDQHTRELVKQIIELPGGNIEAIEKYLKKFKPKDFYGEPIDTVRIAIFKEYAAKRKEINKDFNHTVIDKIPYSEKSRIPQALHNHLIEYEQKKLGIEKLAWRDSRLEQLVNDVKYEVVDLKEEKNKKLIKEAQSEAFSEEGLEALAKKIGIKIRMVTLIEDIGIKIFLKNRYSEADGNPYFIMYENTETKIRSGFASLSSYDIIQRIKNGEPIAEKKEGLNSIILQPNDLVYLPEVNREGKVIEDISKINWSKPTKEMINKIYIVKSFSKTQIFFTPAYVSSPLDKKCNELDNNNKSETAWTNEGWASIKDKKSKQEKDKGLMIKDYCIKLKIDRLGNIFEANCKKLV
jgi:CRISPR-associated endonuclease Csn1